MSEEVENTNDGTWSGLKKTIIATLTTLITGGGAYLGTTIINAGSDDKEETKTEQVAPGPAAAPITINVQQNQENTQQQKTAAPTIIKERVIEKQVPAKEEKKKEEPKEEAPW
jgi:hypothetical protein